MGVCWLLPSEEEANDPMGEVDFEDRKVLNMPILQQNSPYGFLVSYMRLSLNICKRHKVLIPKVCALCMSNHLLLIPPFFVNNLLTFS